MQYNDIINILKNEKGIKVKQREIAEILGLRVNAIGLRSARGSEFTVEEIQKIGNFYNIDLFHNYKMQENDDSENEILADYYSEFELINNELSGKKETVKISKSLIEGFMPEKKYVIIKAFGDSMNPNIKNGDKLIIEDYTQDAIKDNQIYFFFYNKQFFVKRLISNINKVVVKSDNSEPIYAPEFISRNDMTNIRIIGKISGLIRNYA